VALLAIRGWEWVRRRAARFRAGAPAVSSGGRAG